MSRTHSSDPNQQIQRSLSLHFTTKESHNRMTKNKTKKSSTPQCSGWEDGRSGLTDRSDERENGQIRAGWGLRIVLKAIPSMDMSLIHKNSANSRSPANNHPNVMLCLLLIPQFLFRRSGQLANTIGVTWRAVREREIFLSVNSYNRISTSRALAISLLRILKGFLRPR